MFFVFTKGTQKIPAGSPTPRQGKQKPLALFLILEPLNLKSPLFVMQRCAAARTASMTGINRRYDLCQLNIRSNQQPEIGVFDLKTFAEISVGETTFVGVNAVAQPLMGHDEGQQSARFSAQ
jgi:hypothetical protein